MLTRVEKLLSRDVDDLTPLDAHNSLLTRPTPTPSHTYDNESKQPLTYSSVDSFANDPGNPYSGGMYLKSYVPQEHEVGVAASSERLVRNDSSPGPRSHAGSDIGYARPYAARRGSGYDVRL